MPSSPDIERLRALASAATQGERTAFFKSKYDEWHVGMPFDNPGSTKWALFDDGIQSERPEHDAKFIAACDPQTIIALIDAASEAEALRADALRYRWLREALDSESVTARLHESFQQGGAALDSAIDTAIAASKPANAKGGEHG